MVQVGQHDFRGHFVQKSVVLDSSTEITGVNSYKDLSLLVNYSLTLLSRKSVATISLIVLNQLKGARTAAMMSRSSPSPASNRAQVPCIRH